MKVMQAVVILACEEHAKSILETLDESGVDDWTVISSLQARRKGFLENAPRDHPHHCCSIYGCAEKTAMAKALQMIARKQQAGAICVECVAHTWEVQQALLADVALDPVCETVVDRATALEAQHDGHPYHFCCIECLDSFLARPEFFVNPLERVDRVGRRDVVRHHSISESPL